VGNAFKFLRVDASSKLIFFLICLLASGLLEASNFRVEDVHTRFVEKVLHLDADITIQFDSEELDALRNGVALTMIVDMEVARERVYLWDHTIAELNSRQQLSMHALSGQFVLKNLNSKTSRAYRTLDGALEALGNLRDFPVLDTHLLQGTGPYYLRLRARLDIEALPSPLRPIAYLRALWGKTSEWKICQIEK